MPDPAQLEYLPLASLTPYARNARTHSPAQITQLVASIEEFGWTNPVLIDAAGEIIAGHGRVLAAQQIGLVTVPCLRLGHLSTAQKRAYVIADNKLALNAGWDETMLALELSALVVDDFDIGLLGFDPVELAQILDGGDFAETGGDGGEDQKEGRSGIGSLADRFGIPPFSVLNAREGWWQDRKRAWLALGIQSELGRGGAMNAPLVAVAAFGDTLGQTTSTTKQRQAAAPGRPWTTVSGNAATGPGGL